MCSDAPAAIAVIAAGGRVVRAYDARNGAALWDDLLHSASEGPASPAAILALGSGDALITAVPGRVQRRNAATGISEWLAEVKGTES
jgi:hypothetical protein